MDQMRLRISSRSRSSSSTSKSWLTVVAYPSILSPVTLKTPSWWVRLARFLDFASQKGASRTKRSSKSLSKSLSSASVESWSLKAWTCRTTALQDKTMSLETSTRWEATSSICYESWMTSLSKRYWTQQSSQTNGIPTYSNESAFFTLPTSLRSTTLS